MGAYDGWHNARGWAGLFGMNLGVMDPVITLMIHLIFGLVLGLVVDKLPGVPAAV